MSSLSGATSIILEILFFICLHHLDISSSACPVLKCEDSCLIEGFFTGNKSVVRQYSTSHKTFSVTMHWRLLTNHLNVTIIKVAIFRYLTWMLLRLNCDCIHMLPMMNTSQYHLYPR